MYLGYGLIVKKGLRGAIPSNLTESNRHPFVINCSRGEQPKIGDLILIKSVERTVRQPWLTVEANLTRKYSLIE